MVCWCCTNWQRMCNQLLHAGDNRLCTDFGIIMVEMLIMVTRTNLAVYVYDLLTGLLHVSHFSLLSLRQIKVRESKHGYSPPSVSRCGTSAVSSNPVVVWPSVISATVDCRYPNLSFFGSCYGNDISDCWKKMCNNHMWKRSNRLRTSSVIITYMCLHCQFRLAV